MINNREAEESADSQNRNEEKSNRRSRRSRKSRNRKGNKTSKRNVKVFSTAAYIVAASATHHHNNPSKLNPNNKQYCIQSISSKKLPSITTSQKEHEKEIQKCCASNGLQYWNTMQKMNIRGGASSNDNSENYYEILGIHRTASALEIKKAYRRKAVETHPDKTANGDRTQFDRVSEAYGVLSSDEKRAIYDRFGKAGLEAGANTGAHTASSFQQDIFRSFFGPSSFPRNTPHHHRNVKYQLEVSLEELYAGTTKSVSIPIRTNRPYPNKYNNDARDHKQMEVTIPPGSNSGQKIILPGEIDYIDPNAAPGDAIFILVQRPHPTFTRKHADLAMHYEISLKEAICGFQSTLKLLDGRIITITTNHETIHDQQIIYTNDVRVIKGEGMPLPNGERGDLYLQFKVLMPGEKTKTNRSNHNHKQKGSATQHTSSSNATAILTLQEKQELGRLLDKIDGITISNIEDPQQELPFNNNSTNNDDSKHQDKENMKVLKVAKASDFGNTIHDTAESNHDSNEEYLHTEGGHETEQMQNPFFGSSRQFFSYSSRGGNRNTFFSNYHRRSNQHDDDQGEEVQCQQM